MSSIKKGKVKIIVDKFFFYILEIENTILVPKRHILVENFDSRALLLNLHTRKVTQINASGGWILSHVDDQRLLGQVAVDYSAAFALTHEERPLDKKNDLCNI